MKPVIYAHVDPAEPGHVRYVGMAWCDPRRPYVHAQSAYWKISERTYHSRWIRKLHSEGRDYSVLVLEELAEGTSKRFLGEVEKMYIASLRAIGHRLTNISEGGDCGSSSPETCTKMRAAWTPERRAAQSKRARALWTLERKAECSAERSGNKDWMLRSTQKKTDEAKAAMSAAWTPERKAASSDRMRAGYVWHMRAAQAEACRSRSDILGYLHIKRTLGGSIKCL